MHLSCQPLLLLWVWRQFASKAISIISRVWRLWTQISKDQQFVGGDEDGEDMISIFGPKSFNSFRSLKKFAICFRQHPMVTMWQTLFSTNFFKIFLTKHIFSSFPNTIRYAKRQQKLLFLFTTRSQFVSRDVRNAFEKYHLTSQKCFFFSKLAHNQKIFRLS